MRGPIGRNFTAMLIASCSVPALGTAALAQTAQTEQSQPETVSSVDDIVVTARKRSETVNDVPLTIQAVSGEALTQAGVSDTSNLVQIIPALNYSKSSANTPIFTVRGIGFNTPNLSSTSPVGIYVDEVSYAYPYMANGPIFDVARVEVLKGPQGLLYGRNTTGGLVNFITQKPGQSFAASATAEIGNYQTRNVEAYVSGPLSDTVGLRIAVRAENSGEGWQESVSRPGDRLGEKDRTAARLTLTANPNDRLSLDFTANYWRDQSDTVAPQAIQFLPDQAAFAVPGLSKAIIANPGSKNADWDAPEAGKPPFATDSRFWSAALRGELALSDSISLVSLTAYNDLRRRDFNDLDGTPFETLAYGSNGTITSFSQELRLMGDAGPVDWILGAYYSKDKIVDDQFAYYGQSSTVRLLRFLGANRVVQNQYTPAQIASGVRNFLNNTAQDSQSTSVFANIDWKLAEKFTLSGGLRYSDDSLSYRGCTRDIDGQVLPVWNTGVAFVVRATPNVQPNECLTFNTNFTDNVPIVERSLDEDSLAGRLNLSFAPNADTLLYASISRGYKSGAFPVLAANNEAQLEAARQEEVLAYEVGLKATLDSGRLQFNTSGYFYDYKDKQLFGEIPDRVFTTLTRILNVPKSEVYGAEADASWRPAPSLLLKIGASYTRTEITEFTGFDRAGVSTDFAGARFPYTPEWQVNGLVNWDHPVSETLGVSATLSAAYLSDAEGSIEAEPEFHIDAYTLVNANLSLYALNDSWRVGAYVRNLFDKYYWTSADTNVDTVVRIPGMPKTFGVTLTKSF